MIPVLMILLLIIMQFVLWAHAAQVVQLAASEGDRTARSSNGSIIQGIDRARDVLNASDSNVSSSNVSIRVLSADLVETTVTGNVQSILPGMSFSVSATQVGPIQEFRSGE